MLRRESNAPLHRQSSHAYSEDDSSEDSIDMEELAGISLQIQIKNWIDKFRNKEQVKERMVEEIVNYEIQQIIAELNHKDLHGALVRNLECGQEEKGIQSDAETVKYFVDVLKEYLLVSGLMMDYVLRIEEKEKGKKHFYLELFEIVWEKINDELEYEDKGMEK